MTSTKPKDSYPRLTDYIVYGMTAEGPLYILQAHSRQYALVQASVLTSITNTESIGLENTTSHIRILLTRSYRSDEKQNAIRSSLKSIVWVAQNARYTIVAVNTHTHRVEYMWPTSLRYVLGRSEADRRITRWLDQDAATRVRVDDRSHIHHYDHPISYMAT